MSARILACFVVGYFRVVAAIGVCLCPAAFVSANLIVNGSFEPGNASGTGQSILPQHWFNTLDGISADLYTNDGSVGLGPGSFGNFNGVTAQHGIGWIAGGAFLIGGPDAPEAFSQQLTDPLAPGTQYEISGWLHRSTRLIQAGAYEIWLSSVNSLSTGTQVQLGQFDPTVGPDGSASWEYRSLNFVAPANAGALPYLIFRPYYQTSAIAYPALDNVSLTAVPEPNAILSVGFLIGLMNISRQRRHHRNDLKTTCLLENVS